MALSKSTAYQTRICRVQVCV